MTPHGPRGQPGAVALCPAPQQLILALPNPALTGPMVLHIHTPHSSSLALALPQPPRHTVPAQLQIRGKMHVNNPLWPVLLASLCH